MAIISTHINIKWCNKTKEYYISKGYNFTCVGDLFEISTNDLPPSSTHRIEAYCDVCGETKTLEYQHYNKNIKMYGIYTCNSACSKIKSKKTCLIKYADINYNNTEKRMQTSLKIYGFDSPSKNDEVKKKRIKTNIERFGCENVYQNEDIKEKIKNILLKKYNVAHALQNKELFNKNLNTLFNNYGVINPMLCGEIKEKQKLTCINKYGNMFWYIVPRYNKTSIYFFNLLEQISGFNVRHALKIEGEKKFEQYSVDGYIQKLNIVIEWDENYHKNYKQEEKDTSRQKYIENKFGCTFFRINNNQSIKNIYQNIYKLADNIILLSKQH